MHSLVLIRRGAAAVLLTAATTMPLTAEQGHFWGATGAAPWAQNRTVQLTLLQPTARWYVGHMGESMAKVYIAVEVSHSYAELVEREAYMHLSVAGQSLINGKVDTTGIIWISTDSLDLKGQFRLRPAHYFQVGVEMKIPEWIPGQDAWSIELAFSDTSDLSFEKPDSPYKNSHVTRHLDLALPTWKSKIDLQNQRCSGMSVWAMHLGHDASIAIVCDGTVELIVELERLFEERWPALIWA